MQKLRLDLSELLVETLELRDQPSKPGRVQAQGYTDEFTCMGICWTRVAEDPECQDTNGLHCTKTCTQLPCDSFYTCTS